MFEVGMSSGELFHASMPFDVYDVRDFIDWMNEHSVPCGSDWFIALRENYENEVFANISQIVFVRMRR